MDCRTLGQNFDKLFSMVKIPSTIGLVQPWSGPLPPSLKRKPRDCARVSVRCWITVMLDGKGNLCGKPLIGKTIVFARQQTATPKTIAIMFDQRIRRSRGIARKWRYADYARFPAWEMMTRSTHEQDQAFQKKRPFSQDSWVSVNMLDHRLLIAPLWSIWWFNPLHPFGAFLYQQNAPGRGYRAKYQANPVSPCSIFRSVFVITMATMNEVAEGGLGWWKTRRKRNTSPRRLLALRHRRAISTLRHGENGLTLDDNGKHGFPRSLATESR